MSLKVAVQPKSMWRSKTFLVNVAVAILAVLGELQALLPEFADLITLPANWSRLLLLATAIGNIFLRRISDEPARFKTDESVAVPAAKPGTKMEGT